MRILERNKLEPIADPTEGWVGTSNALMTVLGVLGKVKHERDGRGKLSQCLRWHASKSKWPVRHGWRESQPASRRFRGAVFLLCKRYQPRELLAPYHLNHSLSILRDIGERSCIVHHTSYSFRRIFADYNGHFEISILFLFFLYFLLSSFLVLTLLLFLFLFFFIFIWSSHPDSTVERKFRVPICHFSATSICPNAPFHRTPRQRPSVLTIASLVASPWSPTMQFAGTDGINCDTSSTVPSSKVFGSLIGRGLASASPGDPRRIVI